MSRRRGAARRPGLASLAPFGVGMLLGLVMGLPVAHALVELVLHPGPAGISSSTGLPTSSPSAVATPSATPRPTSSATPSPTPSSSPSSPICAPLAAGQHSLDALQAPPPGYAADASLDWLGCGDQTLPSSSSEFTEAGGWLLALSYSCPAGTATPAAGPTITVANSAPNLGLTALPVADEQGDFGDITSSGLGGAGLSAGSHQLQVGAPGTCLWHLAVYPATSS